MRKMVKRLLKKYKYPPEDYDYAINTVISQCQLWTDNVEPRKEEKLYQFMPERELSKVAEEKAPYSVDYTPYFLPRWPPYVPTYPIRSPSHDL